jgi:S-DNA-T family DNA segregation ATPase FtsK/SpoIIIE
MASLADLERLLERIFERTTARLLRARLTAVQLERRVERVMDLARHPAPGRPSVPSAFRVRLQPGDLARVAADVGSAEGLAVRLADAALAHARRHAYVLTGRPTVSIVADPTLQPGEAIVDAIPVAALDLADAPLGPDDADLGPVPHGNDTMAFRRPDARSPRATLRVHEPGGRVRVVMVDGTPLAIGRAPDNGLVIADPRVSRHHARVQARSGLLVFADLGSTNGSVVNGVGVDEVVLGPGDRIGIGGTTLLVEAEVD